MQSNQWEGFRKWEELTEAEKTEIKKDWAMWRIESLKNLAWKKVGNEWRGKRWSKII